MDALARHDVSYVIVGGVAATHWGATRLTQDLDICPEWTRENLDRLAGALTELRAELSIGPDESVPVPIIDGVFLSRIEISTWHTTAGRFDVLSGIPATATSRAGYGELVTRAASTGIGGHVVRVLDLDSLIRSKQIANRPKDQAALPELEAIASRHLADLGHAPGGLSQPPQDRPRTPGSSLGRDRDRGVER